MALLDVVMPKMGAKVLDLSGYSADAIHDSFVLYPGVPLLRKPFGPAALAGKVREALDGS